LVQRSVLSSFDLDKGYAWLLVRNNVYVCGHNIFFPGVIVSESPIITVFD